MADLSLTEVRHLVATVNAARWRHAASDSASRPENDDAEQKLNVLFGASSRLAVYGTLAPGRANHHIVAPLGGEWTDGLIEGDLLPMGWGAALGYPAFRPRVGGAAVAVQILMTPLLVTAWPTLDRFEGSEYQRILVPVFKPASGFESTGDQHLYTVANLYAATEVQ